jgi:hypothetical protein
MTNTFCRILACPCAFHEDAILVEVVEHESNTSRGIPASMRMKVLFIGMLLHGESSVPFGLILSFLPVQEHWQALLFPDFFQLFTGIGRDVSEGEEQQHSLEGLLSWTAMRREEGYTGMPKTGSDSLRTMKGDWVD